MTESVHWEPLKTSKKENYPLTYYLDWNFFAIWQAKKIMWPIRFLMDHVNICEKDNDKSLGSTFVLNLDLKSIEATWI